MSIEIYTDGACSGNPGIGGWGAIILISKKSPIYLNGGLELTTNNQMELTATIKSLEYFNNSENITIFTDSKYVMNGIELWILNWKRNGWKTANRKAVKNKDLWISLDMQINRHKVNWKWVKGHDGNKYNEKADQLARKFIEE
tara:strand:- start:90 stop:518 length:429 start_codon:yes stop_codon:yes gene_type:complete